MCTPRQTDRLEKALPTTVTIAGPLSLNRLPVVVCLLSPVVLDPLQVPVHPPSAVPVLLMEQLVGPGGPTDRVVSTKVGRQFLC